MFESLKNFLFGFKCEKCGKRHHETKRGFWIRGWNDRCNQADDSSGIRCFICGHIAWDISHEEYKKSLPDWCSVYESKPE